MSPRPTKPSSILIAVQSELIISSALHSPCCEWAVQPPSGHNPKPRSCYDAFLTRLPLHLATSVKLALQKCPKHPTLPCPPRCSMLQKFHQKKNSLLSDSSESDLERALGEYRCEHYRHLLARYVIVLLKQKYKTVTAGSACGS